MAVNSQGPGSRANWETIALGTLLLFGLFVRVLPVFHNQVYFGFDQGLDTVLVKQLVADRKLSLVGRYSGLSGVLMGPVWTWILAIPLTVFSGSPAGYVVFFSALQVGSFAVLFFLVRKFLGTPAAFISLALALFSPGLVFYSQVAASPHPLAGLMVFLIWFLLEILVNRKSIFWLPLWIVVGLFFQLEIAIAVFLIPAVFVLLVLFGQLRQIATRSFLLGLGLFLATFIPQVLFDIRHNFLITRGLMSFATGHSNNLYSAKFTLPLPARLGDRVGTFTGDFFSAALFFRPAVVMWLALIMTIGGWVTVLLTRMRKQMVFLKIAGGIILVYLLGFTIYPGPLWNWYRAGFPVVYILLLGVPLSVVWEKVRLARPLVLLVMLAVVFGSLNFSELSDRVSGKAIENPVILENQLAVLDYVYRSASGRPFSSFAYTAPVYDYVWQYDFWWYGRRKYGYLPRNFQMGVPLLGFGKQGVPPKADEGLFYTIVEPDPERPWQTTGWLTTYIRVGKVTAEKKFPGGIVVQERRTE